MKPVVVLKSDFDGYWFEELSARLPHHELVRFPAEGIDPARIEYAVVWQPPAGWLAGLPNLKAIFSIGAGIDHLSADPNLPRHLPVVRMVDPSLTQGMIDYVCWAVLHLHRSGFALRDAQAAAHWRDAALIPTPANERTVGILGLGQLGQAAAHALQAIGFEVIGWSRAPKSLENITCYAGPDGLQDFLPRCDFLVCLLPLTAETQGILNRQTLGRLKRGAGLVNAGRGKQLVEGDLIPLLDSGQLRGAVLDVFDVEPLPRAHAFWRHPRILVTPHIASVTQPGSASAVIAQAIAQHRAGGTLAHQVDWQRGY